MADSDLTPLPRSRTMALVPPAERLRMRSRIDPETGCIIYTGYIDLQTGYGLMSIGHQTRSTHRLAWEIARGPIPLGLSVLHRCDVRACINADHLFLGTQDDNMKDMAAKGRSSRGEKNRKAKLTERQVLAIRADPRPHRTIGEDYGIGHTNVGDIKRRRIWKHV